MQYNTNILLKVWFKRKDASKYASIIHHIHVLQISTNTSFITETGSTISNDQYNLSKRTTNSRGGFGGGAHPARPPHLKLEKIWFFWRKIVIFHMKYPKNFACPSLKLEKYDFFGIKSWFSTRNTPKIFAPPSARRNFFKCAPNLKSWIRPWKHYYYFIKIIQVYFWTSLFIFYK